jgi:hypothetical protein
MAKYDPLFGFLCRAGDGPVEMSFDEIDALVGGLPASAGRQRAWWANELRADAPRHVPARAWLNAERTVERVDLAGRRVRFSAARWNRGS